MDEELEDKEEELAKLTEEISLAYEEMMLLYRTSDNLVSVLAPNIVAERIIDDIWKLSPARDAVLFLREDEGDYLVTQVAKGEAVGPFLKYRQKIGEDIIGQIVAEGKGRIINQDAHSGFIAGVPWPTRSLVCVPLIIKGKALGALVLSDKMPEGGFNSSDLKLALAIASQAAIFLENANLFQQLKEAYLEAIFMLAVACEAKDEDTGNHVRRIQRYSQELARALSFPEEEAAHIGYSSILHDVGKIHVPDQILKKPAGLTPEEWEVMKRHTIDGERILGKKEFFKTARGVARWHHENYAGGGYPDGLCGDQIPIGARIVKLADIYDALTTKRCYKDAWPGEKALETLLTMADKEIDPRLAETFVNLWQKGIITEIQEALKG